jgi:hypothetical protein
MNFWSPRSTPLNIHYLGIEFQTYGLHHTEAPTSDLGCVGELCLARDPTGMTPGGVPGRGGFCRQVRERRRLTIAC